MFYAQCVARTFLWTLLRTQDLHFSQRRNMRGSMPSVAVQVTHRMAHPHHELHVYHFVLAQYIAQAGCNVRMKERVSGRACLMCLGPVL